MSSRALGGGGRSKGPAAPDVAAGTGLPAAAALHIRREDAPDRVTLHLHGALDVTTMLELRDAAFTAVGPRPRTLCLDLSGVESALEMPAINTLVTISRVARMVNVACVVRVRPDVEAVLRKTGLIRMLPLDPLGTPAKKSE